MGGGPLSPSSTWFLRNRNQGLPFFSLFRKNDTSRYKIILRTLFSHAPSVLHPYPLLNRRQPVYRSFLVSGRPKRSPIIVLLNVVTSSWKSRDGQFSSKHQYVSLFHFFFLSLHQLHQFRFVFLSAVLLMTLMISQVTLLEL